MGSLKTVRIRARAIAVVVGLGLLPLACSGAGDSRVGTVTQAASGSCPVTITIPSQNESVGQAIQISVSQSCQSWTNAMIAYIDDVDCASSSYAFPNSGCHTNGGAQNFSSSTWVQVTPGQHQLVVNNWDAAGDVSSSSPITFTYSPPAGVTVSSPTSNSSVPDTVEVQASANESVAINQVQVWDNGTKLGYYCNAGTNSSGGCNTSSSTSEALTQWYNLPNGSNALTVMDVDNSYNVVNRTTVNFTVTGGPSGGVIINTPVGGASAANPVNVAAMASESVAINQMQVWDNGTKLGYYCNAGTNGSGGCNASTSTTQSLSIAYDTLPAGSNALTVEDLDESYNVIHQTTVNFTVSGGASTDPVLVGAGDIGYPGGGGAATGNELQTLVNDNPGAMVFTLGDDAYGNSNCDQGGSPTDYSNEYTPTAWYSLIGKSLPMPGNHEYDNCDLSNTVGPCMPSQNCGTIDGSSWVMNGYWPYYNGHAAVTPGGGTATTLHYGYDFTTTGGKKWRYVSVDSGMCFYTNNCSSGSSEYSWLANELAGHTKASYKGGPYAGIIIGTHIDRWDSAGCPGGSSWLTDMFNLAYTYKVDLWIDGHVHGYERFAQLGQNCQSGETASGCGTFCGPAADANGPVLIDLGSGGADDWSGVTSHPLPNSLKRIASTYAVGRIRMHDSSWDFTLYDTSNNVIDGMVTYNVH